MTEQKCVRTYDTDYSNNCTTSACCEELTSHLKLGWKVIVVTPKADFIEYIIEREVDNNRKEIEK